MYEAILRSYGENPFFFLNVNFLEMISEVLNNIYSPINTGSAFTDTDFLI